MFSCFSHDIYGRILTAVSIFVEPFISINNKVTFTPATELYKPKLGFSFPFLIVKKSKYWNCVHQHGKLSVLEPERRSIHYYN